MRWVSDFGTITTNVTTNATEEDDIFSNALIEFRAFHGFNPEDHGFRRDDIDEC